MDNLDILLEALEHPERFSDSELLTLLDDPDTNRLYRAICASRAESILRESPNTDVDLSHQWEKFKKSHQKKSPFLFMLQRKAAVVALILIASCSVIMVGISIGSKDVTETTLHINQTLIEELPHEEVSKPKTEERKDTTIIFEDEKLELILATVAPYYNLKVDLHSANLKEIRLFLKWDSTMSAPQLIDHLNSFERINLILKDGVITDN